MVMTSPAANSHTTCPSALKIVGGLRLLTVTSMLEFKERITARLESVCGQMGVKASTSAVGKTTTPPAAKEYAVEPVGELTIRPSQRYRVSGSPSTRTLNSMRREA